MNDKLDMLGFALSGAALIFMIVHYAKVRRNAQGQVLARYSLLAVIALALSVILQLALWLFRGRH